MSDSEGSPMTVPMEPTTRKEPRNEARTFMGLKLVIEYKKGDIKESDGGQYYMNADYGYIKNSIGADEEEIDVFIGPDKTPNAYIFMMPCKDEADALDEPKIILGFENYDDACNMICSQYYWADPQKCLVLVTTIEDIARDANLSSVKAKAMEVKQKTGRRYGKFSIEQKAPLPIANEPKLVVKLEAEAEQD